tara:strand:+ start:2092 stop:4938 length:2847 start_codon:yes stop_codon:yes gene_type:complete
MAITLTLTASNATPSQENLPEDITITAVAVDSGDPSAVFAFSWHFLGTPPGTTATLANNRAATTQFTADLWGSYRLFCIAQNTTSGETSIVDPLAAPSSSFLDVEVLSENYDLIKPAKTQREWQERYWHLVDTVENLTFNGENATQTVKGVVELANELEAATAAGANDSTSGADFCITPEILSIVLGSDRANGALASGTINVLRNNVKDAAQERMNEVSITEMADVDTTTAAPTPGQALIWSPSHTDDSGDNDTGAWVPGDVSGVSTVLGAGLCAGETLNTMDFLIYQEDCNEVPVAGAVPGWHARNRFSGENFALNFPIASPGRATSGWHSVAEAAGTGTWADNEEALGLVQIASAYNTAKANLYNHLVYTNGSEIAAAQATGSLKSFAMSPYHFLFSLGTATFSSIPGLVDDIDKDGERIVMYDVGFHTSTEIAALAADVAGSGTFDRAEQNVMALGLTNFFTQRMSRSSITRLADVDTTTHAPALGDLLYWDAAATDDSGLNQTGAWVPKSPSEIGLGSGSAASAGNQFQIQIADASNGFAAANWSINASNHLLPSANDAYDIGSSTLKVRDLYLGANSLHLDTNTLGAEGGDPKWNSTFTIPYYSGTPSDNQILKWDGSSWALAADNDSGGIDGLTSNSSDTVEIDSGYAIIPNGDNTQDLGADDKKFRRIYVNELTGDSGSTDDKDTRLSLNAEIPGNAASGLRAAALYSRGSIAMMIDTNNTGQDTTNSFFVYEGGEDDSTATERFSVQNDGNVRINNAYSLPTSDGSQNEVMITNGNGQCSFVDVDTIVSAAAGQTYETVYSEALLGNFQNEIPYNNSGYTLGTGESPLMFMFRNVSGKTLKLKNFTFTCAHMHSSTMSFSFVGFTHAQLLNNTYVTISNEFTMNRANTDAATNNEGIGSLENSLGSVSVGNGEYFGVFMNSFEKSGHDNERFFLNIEATE